MVDVRHATTTPEKNEERRRGDRGSASFYHLWEKVKEEEESLGNCLNELYQLKVALIGNNVLLILSTRKQKKILTRFFYSENFNIYDHSTKIGIVAQSTGKVGTSV